MTTSQLQALKADMLVNPDIVGEVAGGNDGAIAAYYSEIVPALGDAWRTAMTPDEFMAAINWTVFIGRTQGERDALRMLLTATVVRPSRPNVRAGFSDIFSGGTPDAVAQRAALAAAAKRAMRRVEKLLAAGPTDGAFDLTFEGEITHEDVARARTS